MDEILGRSCHKRGAFETTCMHLAEEERYLGGNTCSRVWIGSISGEGNEKGWEYGMTWHDDVGYTHTTPISINCRDKSENIMCSLLALTHAAPVHVPPFQRNHSFSMHSLAPLHWETKKCCELPFRGGCFHDMACSCQASHTPLQLTVVFLLPAHSMVLKSLILPSLSFLDFSIQAFRLPPPP
jgi:hypothetical protein